MRIAPKIRKKSFLCVVSLLGVSLFLSSSVFGWGLIKEERYLGIMVQSLSGDLHDYFKLPEGESGVLVTKIYDKTPATDAGIQVGDIITSVNGKSIASPHELRENLLEQTKNEPFSITVYRAGDKITLNAVFPEVDEKNVLPFFQNDDKDSPFVYQYTVPQEWSPSYTYLGVMLQDLTSGLRDYFSLKSDEGVLISEVVEDSPAAKGGLKAGDIILVIDGTSVSSAQEVKNRIRSTEPGKTMDITFIRKGEQQTAGIELEERTGELFHRYVKPWKKGFNDLQYLLKEDSGQEFKSDMESLKEEMKELQKELQSLKEELRDNRSD